MIDDYTIIIKTFERFQCIKRLVATVLKVYPNACILIGDDSQTSCKRYFEKHFPNANLKVFELPKDCGLSYGRNYLLDHVETKYFILCDDDFMFDDMTDLESGLQLLNQNQLDIIGGYFRNYSCIRKVSDNFKVLVQEIFHLERLYNYIGSIVLDENNRILYAEYITNEFPDFTLTDITHNFFIGRTKIIRETNRWDDELKVHEHTAFFLKAKQNNLRVGFTNKMSVRHKPIRSQLYSSYRNRDFFQVFLRKYKIKRFVVKYNGITVRIVDCL